MPSFSFQISFSFLHKSINCNNRFHFITAWIKVLHMKSFIPKWFKLSLSFVWLWSS
jgi:hypothetical protein